MQLVKCSTHNTEFRLPSTDDEFLSGKLHSDVERISDHHQQFSVCKFVEVRE